MMRLILLSFICLAFVAQSPVLAQDATPAPGCTVAPRDQAEIDALITGPATPTPAAELAWPIDGQTVDPVVEAELENTLLQVEWCIRAGDLPRLFALTTDAFIQREFLAAEPVLLVPGGPGTPVSLQPVPEEIDWTPVIHAAVLVEDGSIVAVVSARETDSQLDLVRYTNQEGRWLIDVIQAAPADLATPEPSTPVDPIVTAVLSDALAQTGVAASDIVILEVTPVEWPDSALGCPVEGGVYMAVITPGYRIVLDAGGETLEYHTDLQGNFVPCA